MTTNLPSQSDTIIVRRDVHLEQIAGVIGTNIDLLRSLNPEYRRDIAPGNTKPCAIRLPLADSGKFIDNEDSIYNYRVSDLLTKRAVVDVNDDVPTFSRSKSSYSKRHGRRSRRAARNTRRGRNRGGSSITIQRGQTLSQIAKRNGTTVAKLRKLNGLRGNNIQAGKKIRVR